MAITPVETAVLNSTLRGLPFLGKKILKKAKLGRLANEAQARLVSLDNSFLSSLVPDQISALKNLIGSPAFDHLALQALVFRLGNLSDKQAVELRHEIRETIRHTGAFKEGDLYQATDALLQLLNNSVHAVEAVVRSDSINNAEAASVATQIAAAAARNSDVLRRLDSLEAINEFASNMRTQVRSMHTRIVVALPGESRTVDYSDLYVEPNLIKTDKTKINFSSLVNQLSQWIILGDPGAGKSTLASKLAYDIAANAIPQAANQIPILLIVRQHTESLRDDHNTLIHYLEATCRHPYNLSPPADALEYLLLNGFVTVIIDGVDELGDSRYRRKFVDLVNGFTYRYPLVRIVATSRIIGYREAPLEAELFSTVTVAPFTPEQTSDYAGRWFGLDASITVDERPSWSDAFIRESEQAADLRQNPLALSLLCALFRTRHSLPRNKPEIYEECAKLLFDMWDRHRGIDVPYHFAAHIRPAVQRIAWLMFTDARGRQAVPRRELRQFLAEYMLIKRFPDPDEAIQAADDFLRFCAGRAWVLTDMGSDAVEPHYGFVHRTFLEYFAASQLVKNNPEPQAVWSNIRSQIASSQWDVVSQLSVQILDRSFDDGADQLLELLLQELSSTLDTNRAHDGTLPSFAARTLDNIAPGNEILGRVVRAALNPAIKMPVTERKNVNRPAPLAADLALTAALRVRNPDNLERIANVIASVLKNAELRDFGDSSASLLYAAFLESPWTFPVGEHLQTQLLGHPIPAEVSAHRYLMFSPTTGDVERLGIKFLFDSYTLCDLSIPSTLSRIVDAFNKSNSQSDTDRYTRFLESAYWSVLEHWPREVNSVLLEQSQANQMGTLNWSHLQGRPPYAKATLLLLQIPVLNNMSDGKLRRRVKNLVLSASDPFGDLPLQARRLAENHFVYWS